MSVRLLTVFLVSVLVACASDARRDPATGLVERKPAPVQDAPTIDPSAVAPANRASVRRGEYMVELLGCGACHTNGALVGTPDIETPLSGSEVGIALTTPLQNRFPAVLYAPNLTPDLKTGIGGWSDEQLVNAIRAGKDRHGGGLGVVMPWRGYSRLTDEDAYAIADYLRSLDPVEHRVPDNVAQGQRARKPFVYFGVYEKT